MKYIILGAGVIGVAAAYALSSRGHEVEVIDRAEEPGRDTSFANGGQLSFSHAEPWANPEVLPKVLPWMLRDDAPLVLRPRADLAMIRWGLSFLNNCTFKRAMYNSRNILRLGLYSKEKTALIRKETGIAFDHLETGILHIFSSPKSFDHAVNQSRYQQTLGGREDVLDAAACLAKEPALIHSKKTIVGGVFAPVDESGDAFLFTKHLADYCARTFGTLFSYNTAITSLESNGDNIVSVHTDKGIVKGDAYIMAAGPYSTPLLNPLGIRVPIYPMKGYSITLPADENTPTTSITDSELKIVYSRLGNRLRVAGTAEFAGYNHVINEKRITPLVRAVKTLFPKTDISNPGKWACLRPSTPDGPPILGKTKYKNLYLNTGHGTLGWTQAAASAYILADIVENRTPEISLEGLTLERYG